MENHWSAVCIWLSSAFDSHNNGDGAIAGDEAVDLPCPGTWCLGWKQSTVWLERLFLRCTFVGSCCFPKFVGPYSCLFLKRVCLEGASLGVPKSSEWTNALMDFKRTHFASSLGYCLENLAQARAAAQKKLWGARMGASRMQKNASRIACRS